MAIRPYLAMTAAELWRKTRFDRDIAWMACHFSAYGTGLSNLPASLPPGSLLILNDRMPIHGHDPERILEELSQCMEEMGCSGLLLDFQQPGQEDLRSLAEYLTRALPCPVGVSSAYAQGLDCAVCLPPSPPQLPLGEHLQPWAGRSIWLELALDGAVIQVTEDGAQTDPLPYPDHTLQGFSDKHLHCHYQLDLSQDAARFTLWRTPEDLGDLLAEAEAMGVSLAVGLYQELKTFPPGGRWMPVGQTDEGRTQA